MDKKDFNKFSKRWFWVHSVVIEWSAADGSRVMGECLEPQNGTIWLRE
jgi:hypothetical protein